MGAGVVGRATAWRLVERGLSVTLVDPTLEGEPFDGAPSTGAAAAVSEGAVSEGASRLSGSQAALGVLMARVFHRSSGRAWRLRQQSHALWDTWLAALEGRGHRLPRRRGLLLLAATPEELARQERLAADRARLGLPLRRLDPEALEPLHPALPGPPLGGLFSPDDGQLDPEPVLAALLNEARRRGLICRARRAEGVERGRGPGSRWRLCLAGGEALEADWLVLASGLGTGALLAGLGLSEGLSVVLEPVLGQALELEWASPGSPGRGCSWPGVVVWRGMNLVPRPDPASGGRRLWLGATLEPGDQAAAAALADLRTLGGAAPAWLREAKVVRRWQGLRGKPVGQPAPLHLEPEPGLLLACGHYRNGVLLAPATAEWVCERIGFRPLREATGRDQAGP
ncbi:MAG: FAD-dependent oxidoreductase [Cyanobacteriota bacterium]|nr:FAD-dependent oxidoreductase [Cyanobacteriota bacterium]